MDVIDEFEEGDGIRRWDKAMGWRWDGDGMGWNGDEIEME